MTQDVIAGVNRLKEERDRAWAAATASELALLAERDKLKADLSAERARARDIQGEVDVLRAKLTKLREVMDLDEC